MDNTSIIAGGTSFDIGTRVVLWNEDKGLSFYKKAMKYGARKKTLTELQSIINCFVLHHAASYTAKTTYNGLVGRGLSVNFIIDDDNINGVSTIYQCLDISDIGYSHKPLNDDGPGVEIAYQVEAIKYPNAYSELNKAKMGVQSHQIIEDTVHGMHLKVYAPSDPQVKAVAALLWGFSELFPKIRSTFPRNEAGDILKTTIANPTGFLGHLHITKEKIDPSGFPFQQVEEEVKARKTWGY